MMQNECIDEDYIDEHVRAEKNQKNVRKSVNFLDWSLKSWILATYTYVINCVKGFNTPD